MNHGEERLFASGSPFELVPRTIDGQQCLTFRRGPRSLPELYRRAAASARNVALVSGTHRMTYGELFARADCLASRLRQYLLSPGAAQRVGLLVEDRAQWLTAFVAVTRSGATAVIMDPGVGAREMLRQIELTDCRAIISDEHHEQALCDARDPRPRLIVRASNDVMERVSGALDAIDPPNDDAEALIAFTSGSTGSAKGVRVSHRALMTGMMNMMLAGALVSARSARSAGPARPTGAPASLLIAPFSHISGYSQFLLMTFLGGKLVVDAIEQPKAIARLVEQENVRSIVGASTGMLRELAREKSLADELRSLTSFSLYGEALHSTLREELIAAFPLARVTTGYGMTETNGSVCVASDSELAARATTSGQALPTATLRIAASQGGEAKAESVGEIWVRGAMLMKGYCGSTMHTEHALDEGWLKTGDLGRIDAEGYLHVTGRLKDCIEYGGHRVSGSELEALLIQRLGAAEVGVVALQEEGAAPRLIVALVEQGASPVDDTQVRRVLEERQVPHADRVSIVRLPVLPRTRSAKIDRSRLVAAVSSQDDHGGVR